MGLFYANAIILGKDGIGRKIDFNIAMEAISKKFGDEVMDKLKKEITAILISKGHSDLVM